MGEKNDVSLALGDLPGFLIHLRETVENQARREGIDLILFGHVGDGNIHVNYSGLKSQMNYEDFLRKAKKFESQVFDQVEKLRGSISAEHGIGLLRKTSSNDLKHPVKLR